MRHMVFMKFKPGCFNDAVFEDMRETFLQLQNEMKDDIFLCSVLKNCVERGSNMDVLIEMELRDELSLAKYLKHPLHIGIGQRMDELISERRSFDCE